ncbi:MAG TPA: hypothetical protein VL972_01705, partial [Solirubrobacteraceae bacterium]|nr:hypothetical protein [Solirubrobacteraceae bacterium]
LSGEGEVGFTTGSTDDPDRAEARIGIDRPGAYPLVEHEGHTAGVLELELEDGVECHGTCFTPGLA